MQKKSNIVLIGMPGAGKSTVGVLLAKAMAMRFVDTDLMIQEAEGRPLQEILDEKGYLALRAIEESVITRMQTRGAVIATGGSAVYSTQTMDHLREHGRIVYLRVGIAALRQRAVNLATRGIACPPGYTFEDIFRERSVLFDHYGEVVIDCLGKNHEGVVDAIRLSIPGPAAT